MKKEQCNYYAMKVQQMAAQMEFESLNDMCKFIDINQTETVFIINNEDPLESAFAIYYNACLLLHKTEGFKTLDAFISAQEKGFKSAAFYYEALAEGYTKHDEYVLVKEAGINDLATFETMKKKGFITGFPIYKELIEKNPDLLKIAMPINNPFDLYTYSQKNNFKDFAALIEAFNKGFVDANLYAAANELGFPTYLEFVDAGKRGFRIYTDLKLANDLKIRDAFDYNKYKELEYVKKDNSTHDQRVLLVILSKIEQGKKISLNKLNTILQTTLEEYKYSETKEMPEWFIIGINNVNDIADFLAKSEQVKKFGDYNADGEFFEINQMQDRSIVLDASNVAHNNAGRVDKKVHAQNIVLMIEFLKTKGFSDIIVIADASLRHKIDDPASMEKVKQISKYMESPKETSADMFLIQYIKINHCLIVSNDTFREWKIQDPWAAENIDFYRLSFIIKDSKEVLMPDLK